MLLKTSGKVWYKNENILDIPYKNRIKKGIYALCEDRKNTGLLMQHSVKENIVFTANQIFNDFSHLSILKYLGLLDRKKQMNKYQIIWSNLRLMHGLRTNLCGS